MVLTVDFSRFKRIRIGRGWASPRRPIALPLDAEREQLQEANTAMAAAKATVQADIARFASKQGPMSNDAAAKWLTAMRTLPGVAHEPVAAV